MHWYFPKVPNMTQMERSGVSKKTYTNVKYGVLYVVKKQILNKCTIPRLPGKKVHMDYMYNT